MRSFLPVDGVVDVGTGLEHTGVDPEERELTHERVGRDLKRQGGEGRLIGELPVNLLTGRRVRPRRPAADPPAKAGNRRSHPSRG